MANETMTPNMNLIIPGVGTTESSTWASDLNASLSIVDQHDHSSGSGVQITPGGLNINSALSFNSQSATSLASIVFTAGSTVSTLDSIWFSGVDMYVTDGSGNQIRITQGGSLAGAAGTITGLPSGTASASYAAGTFTFQSATSTAANIDGGSLILRNSMALSKGLTLAPPNAMAANYGLVLPSLPSVQSIMTLDASGNMAAPYTIDGTTLVITAGVIGVKNLGITTAQLANASVTHAKLSAFDLQASSTISFSTTSLSYVPVTGLSITITTTGRPVYVLLVPDGSGTEGYLFNNGADVSIGIRRDSQSPYFFETSMKAGTGAILVLPPGAISAIDGAATAGSHTYQVYARLNGVGGAISFTRLKLQAYEIA